MSLNERTASEYEAAINMLQDTGQTVWLVNGAYLLATTVLLGALLSLLGQDPSPPRWVFVAGGVVCFVICLLWWGSFERAYAFYNFRIDFARSLETDLGYSVLTQGRKLSDGEAVKISGREHRIGFPGRLLAMQWWSRSLIGLMAALSILTAVCLSGTR